MRVVVLTTSYPRGPEEIAGAFIQDAVGALRAEGLEVTVVTPAAVRHFGIAYGHGIPGNLRRSPWKLLALPLFLLSFVREARRAARGADVVHAHWLPSGFIGLLTGKPVVVQAWGSDVELARRAPWLFRPMLRRARVLLAASESLAHELRLLGATDVRVVPSGVEIPETIRAPVEPPHILYAGRLSKEKGVLELIQAAHDLPLVVVGDGPLRSQVPGAVGFVAPAEIGAYLERASVVACPSRREGYGVIARQAMAYGRPVVATRVGGLADAVIDGETGLLVPPGDVPALRQALETLLGDRELRASLGSAGRRQAASTFGLAVAARATTAAYREALRRGTARAASGL
jgi:glycosyltransferase involved in cell wall biosynthesis